jgi:hypothetical protein
MTDEVDEKSDGSRGSHADAWAVEHGGSIVHVAIRAYDAHEWAGGEPFDVVPLCRSQTLTDAEREALKKVLRRVREDYFTGRFADSVQIAAVIDGLLERTK